MLLDDNGGTLTKYLNGDGIDNKLRVQTGTDVKYFLADHLGSTNALTDSSGNITSSASYDSFGNATGNLATRYQFTGREFDNFTGLHYYRARWYDGNLGRFISEDPIGFAGGDVNLYGYVRNKPLNFYDPFGLDEYSMMERLGNQQPSNRSIDETLDELQLKLGVIGMTPVVGEPFDALDGLISLGRGDYCGASLSASSMIPFFGTASGITKIGKQTNKIWNANPKKGLDNVGNAFAHWKKHKNDFPEYNNSLDYVKGAKIFFDNPPPTSLSKVRPNGDKVIFDPTSGLFGIERNGMPSTFFRPNPSVHGRKTNLEYFYDQ